MHQKDFNGWNALKQKIHHRSGDSVPSIKEREIWWCSIGVNVGDEEDGHNDLYNRPVLVVRKFNRRIFWGLPLTSKIKDNPFYFPLELKGVKSCAMLSQLRLYDTKRLKGHTALMGTLPAHQFNEVIKAIKALLPSQ
jgi:mRNA interferase MazF